MKNYRRKWLGMLLAFAMVLTVLAPAARAEAAVSYKNYTNAYGKAGWTTNITGLKQLLQSEDHAYAYLRNLSAARKYSIPAGDYGDLRLRVNAPLSEVWNRGTFKIVKISELNTANGWHEYAKGNSFSVVDSDVKMYVEKDAAVDKLYFKADAGKVDLTLRGEVKKTGFYGDKMEAEVDLTTGDVKELHVASEGGNISVNAGKASSVETVKVVEDAVVELNANTDVKEIVLASKADVTITGNAEKINVTVTDKAEGAKVETSVPVEVTAGAKVELTLNSGAEGTTVTKTDEKVELAVENNTSADVVIGTEGNDKTETVGKGDTTTGGTTGGGSTGGGSSSGGSGTGGGEPEKPVEVTKVEVTAEANTVEIGKTIKLEAKVAPENAADKSLTWSSDKPEIATVDQTGLVTGVSAGAVTIKATAKNGVEGTCNLTVTKADEGTDTPDVAVTNVTLDPTEAVLEVGETVKLKATVTPEEASNKAVTWESDNEKVATVAAGVVTAVASGKATITVTTVDGGRTATCEVTVTPEQGGGDDDLVTSITVTAEKETLKVGETTTVTAIVEPKTAEETVTWSSSDSSIAEVSEAGVVTAKKAGVVTITAAANDNSGVEGSCEITVKNAEVIASVEEVRFTYPENPTEKMKQDMHDDPTRYITKWLQNDGDITETNGTALKASGVVKLSDDDTLPHKENKENAEFPIFLKINAPKDSYDRIEVFSDKDRASYYEGTEFNDNNTFCYQEENYIWVRTAKRLATLNSDGSWTKTEKDNTTWTVKLLKNSVVVSEIDGFTLDLKDVDVPQVIGAEGNVLLTYPERASQDLHNAMNDDPHRLAAEWFENDEDKDVSFADGTWTVSGTIKSEISSESKAGDTQDKLLSDKGAAQFPIFVKLPMKKAEFDKFEVFSGTKKLGGYNSDELGTSDTMHYYGEEYTWFKFGKTLATLTDGKWNLPSNEPSLFTVKVYKGDVQVAVMKFTIVFNKVTAPESTTE